MSYPLPILFEDKLNSPELLAFLQQFGQNLYVDANEINQIKNALNWLYNNAGGGSGVTNNTGYSPFGENYEFNAFFGWKLNGIDYALSESLVIPVPYASPGMHRIDLIVTQGDTLVRFPGIEVSIGESAAEPVYNQLENLRITAIPVNEDGYGEASSVIDVNQYQTKNEKGDSIHVLGSYEFLKVGEQSYCRIQNQATGMLKAIAFINNNPLIYPGKDYTIKNETATILVLKHMDTTFAHADYKKFWFYNGLDLVLQPGESAVFHYSSGRFEFMGINRVSASSKKQYLQTIKVDGGVGGVLNGWFSYYKGNANWDQATWTNNFGSGTSLTLSTFFQNSVGFKVPGGTKLVKASIFFEGAPSSGQMDFKFQIHTNEHVSNTANNVVLNNQQVVTASLNTGAPFGFDSVYSSDLPINTHIAFTEKTMLYLAIQTGIATGYLKKLSINLIFEEI